MFDPEQIKSADPVTYDDNGNVIPLSQRFNHRNSDVRFSINPNLRADVEEALRKGTGPDSKQKKRHENVIFSEAPEIFRFVGIPDLPVVSDVTRIRKMSIKHSLTSDQIADLPNRYQSPVAVMRDGNGYVILTDMMATSQHRELKPVRMFVRPVTWKTGERILLATALSENAVDEKEYYEPRIKGGLLYADKNKIAGLALEEETESILRTQASGDTVLTAEDFSSWSAAENVSQSAYVVNPEEQNRDIQNLYIQASQNIPMLKDIAYRLCAKSVMGTASFRLPNREENDLQVKKRDKIIEKANLLYGGDVSQVVDIIAATVTLSPEDSYIDTLSSIDSETG